MTRSTPLGPSLYVAADCSCAGAQVNVRIPSTNSTLVQSLPLLLLERYHTWVPVFALPSAPTTFYVRVSAQIYNDLSDFEMLANAVLALIANPPLHPPSAPSPLTNPETDHYEDQYPH
jgi:hypothetical protein